AEDLRVSSELYEALTSGEEAKVIEICAGIPKGPLHTPTIHNDSVLSLATFLKKNDLVLQLLDMVPMCDSHKLTWQNSGGHTMLHETVVSNKTVEAAAEMLARAPMLLSMTNRLGETALFTAATNGRTKIFNLLHREITHKEGNDHEPNEIGNREFLDPHCLQINVIWDIFLGVMAHEIASKYPHLINEKDGDEMTPLQLLSCSPPVFGPKNFEDTNKMFPWLRKLKKEKHRCEWALKLVKVLVKADMSWQMTESWLKKGRSTVHQYGKNKSIAENEHMTGDMYKQPDTPLLLATIHGCTEIVEEIVKVYPQAIEHIDHEGRNILSLAVLHRRIEIIDLVDRMNIKKQRVRNNIDNYGNTLLHLVGEKVDNPTEDLKGPALILQEDVLLFKRVKEICLTLHTMRLNSKGKTAEQVFMENNNKLRAEAKEWMTENAKNCSIVAVLIATVAFAAAYTVPGGPDSKTGHPVLKNQPLFLIFTIADAISLSSSLTSFYRQLGGAIYHAFKQMTRAALSRYHNPKPGVWHYNRQSRHQTT
ncbi:hypothetical protein M8C21_024647, partial [Ambrosia artemisiifolia]